MKVGRERWKTSQLDNLDGGEMKSTECNSIYFTRYSYIRLIAILVLLVGITIPGIGEGLPIEKILIDKGFKVEVYAEGMPDARAMTRSPSGTIYVGSRRKGNLYSVVDKNKDHNADEVHLLATGMNMPNGVAFRNGSLYVAEVNRVLRYDHVDEHPERLPDPVIVNDSFPTDTHHGWKFIDFGPDGKLYIPIGSPCNICLREDSRYASIMRMNPEGTGLELFASGVRNTVGFDWHPVTGELWFTDNGADKLGDNIPPDELNRAPVKGLHFGHPYCHGGYIRDPEYGGQRSCDELTPPALNLAPHIAALGAEFYTGSMFPSEYKNQLFIAEHGSWNRRNKLGYRVMVIRIGSDGNPMNYEVFAEGWLQGEEAWGRPVDLLQLPDGSLLVSDDRAGAIYRFTYDASETVIEARN